MPRRKEQNNYREKNSVKGVETQTRKLMEVCRMRNTPNMTFINKLDREGMTPLDILGDIEESLQIECAPPNPFGSNIVDFLSVILLKTV